MQLSPDVETVEQARVAIDAQGAATAVWLAQRDGIFTVRSASRPPGQPWQAPVEVSAKDDHPYELRLAVNTRGDALALWRPDTTIAGPIHADVATGGS